LGRDGLALGVPSREHEAYGAALYHVIDVADRKKLRRILHMRSSLASAEKEKQFSWPRRPLSAG
jgi:hypothetical protein